MGFLHIKGKIFLRISLGVVFFWFGVLKLFASGTDLALIQNSLSYELATSQILSIIIAFLEILLGTLFFSNRFVRITAIIAIVYLAIISLLVLATQGFDPRFPVLSLAGEAMIRNLVLIAALVSLALDNKAESSQEQTNRKTSKVL